MASIAFDRSDESIIAGYNTSTARATTVGLWALLVLHTLLSGGVAGQPWMWVTFAAGFAGALLLTQLGGRLSTPISVALVVCSVVASLVLLGYQDPSDSIWMYIYAAYIVAVQACRGNVKAALTGTFLICLVGSVWASFYGASLAGYVTVLTLPLLNAVAFVSLYWVMKHYVTLARQHRTEAARAAEAKLAAAAALELGRRELEVVRREAEPLLQRLVAGEAIDEALRNELIMIEATIRDRIRSPKLQHPLLVRTIRELRARGVAVVLLGEADDTEVAAPMSYGLANAVRAHIVDVGAESSSRSRVTIRALSELEIGAATVHVAGPDETYRVTFAEDGTVISRR